MAATPADYRPAYDEATTLRREALVMQHLPQVRLIARRIHERLPSYISLDDLISTGVIGLLAAIDNFDESLNVQLKTYAERRIRGAIMDSLRELDWAPRETRKKSKVIEAAIHKSKQRYGREPSEEEIAAELGIDPEEYQRWLSEIQAIDLQALEYVNHDGGKSDLLRVVPDPEENWPSHVVERSELERILALAIERMPKLERTVLNLYYFEELSLAEISKIVKLHLSRVAQLRVQGVLRLRSHLQRVWTGAPRRKQ
ncbi:MAG TPA: FliA/WhiG family RNA polymerase sigma factor [Bryobacteraceae bacterium]|nr:FliA/WhiG family RNA polymerase sigma factor [Bryobacteraceae bacterium]